MLFNSLEFAIFLPIVFLIYWFVLQRNLKLQNLFIVVVSYIFYGWWNWRLLFLIALSLLIFIHELGHFIFAKLFNVYCLEFSIGMGPAIISKKLKKDPNFLGYIVNIARVSYIINLTLL